MLLVAQKRFPILSRTGKEAAVSHFSLFQVNDSVFSLPSLRSTDFCVYWRRVLTLEYGCFEKNVRQGRTHEDFCTLCDYDWSEVIVRYQPAVCGPSKGRYDE